MEVLAAPAASAPQPKSFLEEEFSTKAGSMFTRPVLDAAEVNAQGLRLNVPKVDVTQQEGYFCDIKARALIDMPPDVVYDVLTHPDNHIIFRSQQACAYRNVLSEKGDLMEVEVEHTATWNFMFLSGVFHTRTIVYQSKSAGTVQYSMTRPSPVLKRFKGAWTLDPCINPTDPSGPLWTLVTLDQDMHPNMIPPPPTDRLLRKMLGGQIKGMFEDMLMEFAALKAGQPQLTYPPDPHKLINAEPLQPDTPPPPPERSSSLLAPSSPIPSTPPNCIAAPSLPSTTSSSSSALPPTPPNSLATPSLTLISSSSSSSSSSSTASPCMPPTPARAHPARRLASPTHLPAASPPPPTHPARALACPTHLPAAEVTAAARALAAAIPAVARLATNVTAHSIDISDSDLECLDSESDSDDTALSYRTPQMPRPAHMGLLSDSLQSFYSCDDDGLDAPVSNPASRNITCAGNYSNDPRDQSKGAKAAAAGGYRYSSALLQELGDWVGYFWYKLPDTGVLGFTTRVVKMAAAGVLTRVLGTSGADMFVSWDSVAEEPYHKATAAGAC